MNVERILVPTDGSAVSRPAEDRAIELALSDDAVLEVVHVVVPLVAPIAEYRDQLEETVEAEAETFVDSVVQRATDAGVDTVEGTVVHGRAHDEIVEHATRQDCDIVVMGTHGRSEHQPYVLGSVTARVLQRSPVEVLVVPTHSSVRE